MKPFLSPDKFLLFLLAGIQFTQVMDFMIMMPLGPELMRDFHLSPSQFSLLVSSFNLCAGLSAFLSLFYADRYDRKNLLLGNYTGFLVCTLGCALAPSYIVLLFMRSLTGFFGGVISAQILSVVGDAFPPQERGKAFGTVMMGFSLASILGVPFGLFLASGSHWNAPFFVLTGVAAVVWLLIFFRMPHFSDHILLQAKQESSWQKISDLFSNVVHRKAIFFETFVVLGHFSIIPFISPYLVQNAGFPESKLGLLYMFGGIIAMFMSPFSGRLTDTYQPHKIFYLFAILAFIPILLITHLPPLAWPLILVVSSSFFLFASGRMVPANTLVMACVNPAKRGGFMGIKSAIGQFSTGFAAFIGGQILSKDPVSGNLLHYPVLGYMAISYSLIAIWMASRLPSGFSQASSKPVLTEA